MHNTEYSSLSSKKNCPESSKIMALWDYKNNDPRIQQQKRHLDGCKICREQFVQLSEKNIQLKNLVPRPQIDTLSKEMLKTEIEDLFKQLKISELKDENPNVILRTKDSLKSATYSTLIKLPWIMLLGFCSYLILQKLINL